MNFGLLFGSINQHIDLPQVAFWLFFLFFVGLCYWNRVQDKYQGYPMKDSPYSPEKSIGFPAPPSPHTYILNEGGTTQAPHHYEQPPEHAEPLYPFGGTPLSPVGNPLLANIGPGAWVMRSNAPMLTEEGELLIQPMRKLEEEWSIAKDDADVRGMRVFDWRWHPVGTVVDFWIDKGSKILRFLEVEVAAGRRMVPIYHTVINEKTREVRVTALSAGQFAEAPMPATPDVITAREEDQLNAYFAAGHFWRNQMPVKPVRTL
jgi:photosynthetic reaction center H subunit